MIAVSRERIDSFQPKPHEQKSAPMMKRPSGATPASIRKLETMVQSRPELMTNFGTDIEMLIRSLRSAKKRGYLTRKEFLSICAEKSRRRHAEAERNSLADIRAVTRVAFRANDEYVQIKALTALRGVEIPTASAILAWTYPNKFGVIDTLAWQVLFKLKVVKRNEKGTGLQASHWLEYIDIIRSLAASLNTTPQLIDRWLWNYFDENYSKRKRLLWKGPISS